MNLRTMCPIWATGLFALLAGCGAPDPGAGEVFDAVWSEFDQLYGGFSMRDIDWDAAGARWRPASDSASDEALWEALTGLLGELDDGHVMLAAPGREVFHSNAARRNGLGEDEFDAAMVRDRYLDHADEEPGHLRGQIGDVAYVWLPYISDNMSVIDAALDARPAPRALVLDLRGNSGGDFTYALDTLGRLTDTERRVFRTRTRNGVARDQFDDWTDWVLSPRPEPFAGPVAVLTDVQTISAAERAVLALRVLPQAVSVGTPTNGAQATMIGRQAPNGWTYSLPVQEIEAADGELYEGRGIPVDVTVRNDPERLAAGHDDVLESALDLLR